MRRFFILLFTILIFVTFNRAAAEKLPVRLHVRAEDDSDKAQKLKLHVRDGVLSCAAELVENAKDEEKAYAVLFQNTGSLRAAARKAAEEKGFDGKISVCVKREYFPARLYGNTILKEGVYPSVCVEIGEAEGKNWWCVIYPEYCVFEETDESTEIRFYSGIRSFFRKLFG